MLTKNQRIRTKELIGLWCLTPLSTIFHISRRTVLLVEESGVSGENHSPIASHWPKELINRNKPMIAVFIII